MIKNQIKFLEHKNEEQLFLKKRAEKKEKEREKKRELVLEIDKDFRNIYKNKMSSTIKDILNNEKKLNEVAKVAFDSVDTDKSGQIDESELEKVMAQISNDMGAEPPSKEDVKEVLEHLDTDHSGKIDFEEFKVLIKDVLTAMIEDN